MTFAMVSMTDGLSVITLHGFLLLRVYRLSKSILLTLALGLVAVSSFVGAFVLGAMLCTFPDFSDRFKLKVPGIIWIACSGAADVLIAITLVILIQIEKKKASEYRETALKRPLRILTKAALESGIGPATWATIALVLYLWRQDNNIVPAMLFCVGKISSITLLYNLNLRKHTAEALMNSDGHLGSSSRSRDRSGSHGTGVFKSWRRNTTTRGDDRIELSVAVQTITETRHERENDDVLVTLPRDGRQVSLHFSIGVKRSGLTFAFAF
ncbi:hypothetical protein P7C70_g6849, partial [Phenoliferia sp. Uapishka_3]